MMPGGWELVLIIVVIVLLFGGKKIPELAKGLGKGIKDFKKAMNEDDEPQAKVEQKEAKELENKTTNEQATSQTQSKEA